MSISMQLCRYLHCGRVFCSPQAQAAVNVEKSALAKLRKSTGYSFSKCKEALQKHPSSLKEAELWLKNEAQTHGWEKATKLQGRATAQGLISILSSPNNAVMVEVNCETDFVARNKKFQSLVQRITQGCFTFSGSQSQLSSPLFKNQLTDEQLSNLPVVDSRLTKDEIALSIGEIGENIKARRGLFMRSSGPVLLAGYTHPASAEKQVVQFGKFGAVVAYKVTSKKHQPSELAEFGRQLCQHIVGMNPLEIGSMETPPPKESKIPQKPASLDSEPVDEESSVQMSPPEEDVTVLVNQEFLLDPDLTVRDFLLQNSIEVIDFVRFECGENTSTS